MESGCMFREGLGKGQVVLSLQLGISPPLSLQVSLFWKEQDCRNGSNFQTLILNKLREMSNFAT